MRINQQLILGEIIVLITLYLLIDVKPNISFDDIQISGLDNLKFPVVRPTSKTDQEFQLSIIQQIKTLQKYVSIAPYLQYLEFTIQNNIRSHKLGKPWRLKINHISGIILIEVEKSDVRLGEMHIEILFIMSKYLYTFSEECDFLFVFNLETHFLLSGLLFSSGL